MNPQNQSTPLNPKVEAYLRSHGLKDALDILNEKDYIEEHLNKFLSSDPDMLKLKDDIRKLSPHNIPILIVGETGTGKELLAKALHGNRKGDFVAVNVAGIPDTLLEAEFFGAKRGAYTGCDRDRTGYLDEAKDGTLFLDEVGDMPYLLQCKLLRVLQENKFRPIGESKEREMVNVRIVAATNCDLLSMIEEKRFRADFYYRICGVELRTKPLRDRIGDTLLIIKSLYPDLTSPPVINGREWKGNVRELISLCESLKILNGK